jgi:transcription antitermination factor NusG
MNSIEKNWFALYTKPRSEFSAEKQLISIGVQNFLPTLISVRQWSDRKKKVTEPLFRGYIFICSNEKQRLQAIELSSIVRCIFDSGKPAIIPEWQIENVKTLVNVEKEIVVHNSILPGQKVLVKSGPLKGIIGVVLNGETGKSLSVSIDLLNRSVVTHFPDDSLVEIIKK